MSETQRHIQSLLQYGAAWNDPEAGKRRTLLEQAWADDGIFVDPLDHKFGREELLEHMANFHKEQPGASFEMASGIDVHHRHHCFAWRALGADGQVTIEAINFGEVDENGRITKMADFFGPLPGLAG